MIWKSPPTLLKLNVGSRRSTSSTTDHVNNIHRTKLIDHGPSAWTISKPRWRILLLINELKENWLLSNEDTSHRFQLTFLKRRKTLKSIVFSGRENKWWKKYFELKLRIRPFRFRKLNYRVISPKTFIFQNHNRVSHPEPEYIGNSENLQTKTKETMETCIAAGRFSYRY